MTEAAMQSLVHVARFGQGPRRVLAVHCTMAQSGAWKGVARALEGIAELTAFDVPGHGRSADWDGHGDFLDHTAAIAADLLDEPMDVVGHSFGAVVALRVAMTHPEKVRTLTLVEPVLMCAAASSDPTALDLHDVQARPLRAFLDQGDRENAARHFNAMWSSAEAPAWEDLPTPVRAGMVRAIPLVLACDAALYKDVLGFLSPGRLEALTCPVHLIRGAQTHVVIEAITAALAARLTTASRATIPGAGHMVPITHASETAAELRAFFSAHPT